MLVIDIGSADTHITGIGYTMNPAITISTYLASSGGPWRAYGRLIAERWMKGSEVEVQFHQHISHSLHTV